MTTVADPRFQLAVVGAHLTGQPLNHELTDRGGRLEGPSRTAPHYRLVALASHPPKPGLLRVSEAGVGVDVEVWSLPESRVGAFISGVTAPLCIGQVELDDGRWVHGFLCEHHAAEAARDISSFGSWLAYRRSLGPSG